MIQDADEKNVVNPHPPIFDKYEPPRAMRISRNRYDEYRYNEYCNPGSVPYTCASGGYTGGCGSGETSFV